MEFEDEVESIFQFDNDLFQEVKGRVKKTKSEKKLHNRQRLEDEQQYGLEMSEEEFKEVQQTDETLDGVRKTLALADTACHGGETACHGGETACHGGETAKPESVRWE